MINRGNFATVLKVSRNMAGYWAKRDLGQASESWATLDTLLLLDRTSVSPSSTSVDSVGRLGCRWVAGKLSSVVGGCGEGDFQQ